jgi:hypothetical protein
VSAAPGKISFGAVLGLLLTGVVLVAWVAFARGPVPVGKPKGTPIDTLRMTEEAYTLGDVRITVRELKRLDKASYETPHYCEAVLITTKPGAPKRQRGFKEILPNEAHYGLFVPPRPPSENTFAVVKAGDGEGRLLLVNRQGVITEVAGGAYLISPDKRYLVSRVDGTMKGITVYDLREERVVSSVEGILIDHWYRQDNTLFYIAGDWEQVTDDKPLTEREVFVFHPETGTFVQDTEPMHLLAGARKIPYDFDPAPYEDCSARLYLRK